MDLRKSTRFPWLAAAQAASLATTTVYVALLAAGLNAMASREGQRQPLAKRAPSEAPKLQADVEPDLDLERPILEVSVTEESVLYRIGKQQCGSTAELERLLPPLARLGGSISVRMNHDGAFIHTAKAIAACREAGFTTVFLVSGEARR